MEVLYHDFIIFFKSFLSSTSRRSARFPFSQNFPIFFFFNLSKTKGNDTAFRKIPFHESSLAGKRCPAAATRRRKLAASREVPSWSGSTHGPAAPIQAATRPSPISSRYTRGRAAPGRVTTPPATSRISARYRAINHTYHEGNGIGLERRWDWKSVKEIRLSSFDFEELVELLNWIIIYFYIYFEIIKYSQNTRLENIIKLRSICIIFKLVNGW